MRRRAVQLVLDGRTQAAVAVQLGVHSVTVAKWMARHRAAGVAGLAVKPTPGRPRFLTPEQDRQVRRWLAQKPTAHGFSTDLWTARRVAELIRRRFDVSFHPNYLRAWLTQRAYSPQRPTRRPANATTRPSRTGSPTTGRASKKSQRHARHLVLIDETGLFLNPVVRRTWSLIGHTPVLDADGGHRHKVSVIGGVSVSPATQRLGFYFATEPDGFFTAEKVVPFLRDLLKHLRGNVIVVWDRGNNHKGPVIRKFLQKNLRLRLEMLPPWAPDHNPMEDVWSWLKYGELANFTPADIPELDDTVVDRLIELKFDPGLLRALWNRCKLPFPSQQNN